MKQSLIRTLTVLATLAVAVLFLGQCDLILGSGGDANVGIDLGAFYGDSGRAITGVPDGISITGFKVSVFGPGMNRIEKTLSVGTRYVNMSVPAGKDRYFTVEAFFTIWPETPYQFDHLRSYKGRAVADLRPGKYVGLYFRMAAGATALLVPDFNNQRVHQASDMTFSDRITDGFVPTLHPADIDIDTTGRIIMAGRMDGESVEYAVNLDATGQGSVGSYQAVYAIAVDRDANFDIDRNGSIDTSVVYYYSEENTGQMGFAVLDGPGPYADHLMQIPGINFIRGMAVDPWTHRLYLVGQVTGAPPQEAIIEYDPFHAVFSIAGGWEYGAVVRTFTHAQFRLLNDIIVKDDMIFVLNETPVADAGLPSIMKFDKGLNPVGSFGHLSTDGEVIVPSTAPGAFYHPKRFIAHENEGLYILDDSNRQDPKYEDYDKIVFIGTALNSSSWATYPAVLPGDGSCGEPFRFFDYIAYP